MTISITASERFHVEIIGDFDRMGLIAVRERIDDALDDHLMKLNLPILEKIVEEICVTFGVTRNELFGSSRPSRIAWPRQVAMTLAYEFTGGSLNDIRRFFNRKDHATVIYARRVVREREETTPKESESINRIREKVRATLCN